MLPSKTFFIHATLILLVAAVWFIVVEQKKSTIAFNEGELVALKQNTPTDELSEEEIDALIDQVLSEFSKDIALNERASEPVALLEDTAPPALIESDDLTLLYTPTQAQIREYGLQMGAVITEIFKEQKEDEIATFYRMLETSNGSLAAELARRERVYTAAAFALKDIPTPTSAAITHIFIANILLDLGEALTQMQYAFKDLDSAITAGRFFEVRMSALSDHFATLNNYFLSRGITFDESEQVSIQLFETNES